MTEYRKPSSRPSSGAPKRGGSSSGPRKPSGGGFRSGTGARDSGGGRSSDRDSRPARTSSFDRPARSSAPRSSESRRDGDAPRRPYKPREEGASFGDRDRRPSAPRSFAPRRDDRDAGGNGGERRPYKPRSENGDRPSYGDRPSAPRSYERKTYGDKKPFVKKDYGAKSFGDKKTYDAKPKEDYSAGSGAAARKGHEHVLYGVHAVVTALLNPDRVVTKIWATEAAQKRLDGAWDKARHPEIITVEKSTVERQVPEGAVHQGLAIAVEPLTEYFLSDIISPSKRANAARQIIVVLDEVTDPHNVGAIMRSMAMFGAKAMVVHKYNAPTVTGVLAKTATGAVEHVPMVVVTNLGKALEELQTAGFYILGLDEKATIKLTETPTDRHIVLVFGNEGEGLREKTRSVCDAIAAIPSFGPIPSLNVSNAAAIALYEVTRAQN